jgi:thymidylate synthase
MNVMFDDSEEKRSKRRREKNRIIEDAIIEMKDKKNKRFELKEQSRRERFETKQRQRQQHHEALMLQRKKRLQQNKKRLLRLRITLNKSRTSNIQKKINDDTEIKKRHDDEIITIENEEDENENDTEEEDDDLKNY